MQFINVTGSFVSFMGFVLFCFFSVFCFNLTIYGCSLSLLHPPLQLTLIRTCIGFGNLTTVIALLAWPKTCVPWWSLTHNNLSLCAVSVSGSLITSATVAVSPSLSHSQTLFRSVLYLSLSTRCSLVVSLPSCRQAKPDYWRRKPEVGTLSIKEREGESCREQEDREAFIVTGPRPQLCLTRSAAVATGTLKCLFWY